MLMVAPVVIEHVGVVRVSKGSTASRRRTGRRALRRRSLPGPNSCLNMVDSSRNGMTFSAAHTCRTFAFHSVVAPSVQDSQRPASIRESRTLADTTTPSLWGMQQSITVVEASESHSNAPMSDSQAKNWEKEKKNLKTSCGKMWHIAHCRRHPQPCERATLQWQTAGAEHRVPGDTWPGFFVTRICRHVTRNLMSSSGSPQSQSPRQRTTTLLHTPPTTSRSWHRIWFSGK